jgi:hypothetical protein
LNVAEKHSTGLTTYCWLSEIPVFGAKKTCADDGRKMTQGHVYPVHEAKRKTAKALKWTRYRFVPNLTHDEVRQVSKPALYGDCLLTVSRELSKEAVPEWKPKYLDYNVTTPL